MKTYYAVGYLCPAAVVVLALAVDVVFLSSDTYGSEVRDWPSGSLESFVQDVVVIVIVAIETKK